MFNVLTAAELQKARETGEKVLLVRRYADSGITIVSYIGTLSASNCHNTILFSPHPYGQPTMPLWPVKESLAVFVFGEGGHDEYSIRKLPNNFVSSDHENQGALSWNNLISHIEKSLLVRLTDSREYDNIGTLSYKEPLVLEFKPICCGSKGYGILTFDRVKYNKTTRSFDFSSEYDYGWPNGVFSFYPVGIKNEV